MTTGSEHFAPEKCCACHLFTGMDSFSKESLPTALVPEMEERIAVLKPSEVNEILARSRAGSDCLCGLPGCDKCAADSVFDRHARMDIERLCFSERALLDTIRTLQAQLAREEEKLSFEINARHADRLDADAELSRLRSENEAMRAAGADCFGLLKLFLPYENGAARNAVIEEEFPRFEGIFNDAETPQGERLRPAAGKEKEG